MDTNLEDSLHLDSDMGVDFDYKQETVVDQDGMTLQDHHEEIAMEFEQIEDQSMLMDTGNEEIIVSDSIGDQFGLQEYQTQEDSNVIPTGELNEEFIFKSKGEIYQMVPASGVLTDGSQEQQPKIVSVKAALPPVRAIAPKKQTVVSKPLWSPKAIAPKQVAIAPKPPKLVSGTVKMTQFGKQYTIAPKPAVTSVKPMTIITNKAGQVVKKVTIPTTQDSATGNAVLAIGKQLVMLPSGAGAGGKIKLVTAGAASGAAVRLVAAHSADKTQIITAQSLTGQQNPKQMMTKVVVQGSGSGEQSAVLTKLAGVGAGAAGAPRFVMQPKTVPISLSSGKFTNVVLGSPTKTGIRFTSAKKQLVLKTPPSKDGSVAKKIVLTAKPQGMPVKTAVPALAQTPPVSNSELVKVTHKVPLGPKTQLHQINVPGKGVQYIRLVTNVGQAKPVLQRPQPSPSKTYVLTDSKGNRIQMDKMSTQPPPLIVTSGASPAPVETKLSPRPKLVKIAPVWSKQGQAAMSRGGQSLLAPLSPTPAPAEESAPLEADVSVSQEQEVSQVTEEHCFDDNSHLEEASMDDVQPQACDPVDSKAALRQLIAETVGSDDTQDSGPSGTADTFADGPYNTHENTQYDNGIHIEQLQQSQGPDHPLIVIPSYMKQDLSEDSDNYNNAHDNSQHSPPQMEPHYTMRRQGALINIEVDPYSTYQPPTSPDLPDNESGGGGGDEMGLRPRKACNCTKSQCLKLYCDCFANGEFCYRCNCTNCHNNLDNELLRQKAIKGCLDRNPNAFRPKIGKSKAGGPETFRRHNKGCNCKRSGCLKNYCECYEAKIACTSICRCVGCRNVEESVERARRREARLMAPPPPPVPTIGPATPAKQPCSFMTSEVIEAVCQCLVAAAVESPGASEHSMGNVEDKDPIRDVIDEFARCLQDIISASSQATPLSMFDEAQA